MKIRIWLTAMIMLLAFGTAQAAGGDFGGLDRDKNGKLEKAEIEKASPEVFKKADSSGNGTLDRDEFQAAGGSSARFDEIDADKNGQIDPDEFRQAASERFKQLDTNRDGRIDSREWSKQQKPIQNPLIFFYF